MNVTHAFFMAATSLVQWDLQHSTLGLTFSPDSSRLCSLVQAGSPVTSLSLVHTRVTRVTHFPI